MENSSNKLYFNFTISQKHGVIKSHHLPMNFFPIRDFILHLIDEDKEQIRTQYKKQGGTES